MVEVQYSWVGDPDEFVHAGRVEWRKTAPKTKTEVATSLGFIELEDLWRFLSAFTRLEAITEDVARGVEWQNFDREEHISDKPLPGFLPGFHTAEDMFCFESPPMVFLCARKDVRCRNAWDKPWTLP